MEHIVKSLTQNQAFWKKNKKCQKYCFRALKWLKNVVFQCKFFVISRYVSNFWIHNLRCREILKLKSDAL